MFNFRIVHAAQLLICLALVAVCGAPCLAQTAGSAAPSEETAGAEAQQTSILQELEAMKKRIAELEAEVKEQNESILQLKTAKAGPAAAEGTGSSTSQRVAPTISAENPSSSAVAEAQEPVAHAVAAPQKPSKIAPFSDHDWTWLNGNPRTETPAFDSKFFTPEIRADTTYTFDFNRPSDHSMGGSSEIFRSQEVQLEQLGVGGDFHYNNVRARLMTQFGMYSVTTPRDRKSVV